MNWKKALFPALFMVGSAPALAAVCADSTYQNDLKTARLAQVTRKTPLYNEYTRDSLCEKTGSCGTKGYLLAGDQVVVTSTQGAWACILFTSNAGRATWNLACPLGALKFLKTSGTLEGVWEVEDQRLLLRRQQDQLLVRGWTQWPWSSSPDPEDQRRLKESGPNMGVVDVAAKVAAGSPSALFRDGQAESDCQLTVRVLGPYLFAADNNACGGMNASFSGVYRQVSKTVSEKVWQNAKAP